MKLTTLDEDLRIHQKLEDEPNDVGGLSAQELKKKFDQAGVTIQKYLNETHLPEEETAVADALSEAKAYADKKTAAVVSNALSQAKTYTDTKAAELAEGLEQVRAYTDAKAADLADEISLAKAHTDEKAAELEQAGMKLAVYDTKQRQQDIFDYTDKLTGDLADELSLARAHTDEKAEELTHKLDGLRTYTDEKAAELTEGLDQAKAYTDEQVQTLQDGKSRVWYVGGSCPTKVHANNGAKKYFTEWTELVDPDGLWNDTKSYFKPPADARVALLFLKLRHNLRTTGGGEINVYLDPETEENLVASYQVKGYRDSQEYVFETVLLSAPITGVEKKTQFYFTFETFANENLGDGETERIYVTHADVIFLS